MSWVPPAPVGQPGYSSSPPSNTSRPSREPGLRSQAGPARGMSSSTAGGGTSSMRDGPSAGAVAMSSSSSRPSAGLDAGAESPPQAFRRPARSMRRPNALSQTGIPQSHQQQQQQQGDAPPPSPLDDRYQGNAQQTWEDDRAHREIARAAGASLADSDSQVFKTALMTKAFQSAARDGKAARTTPSRRGTADELADDDDGLSEGEFAAIGTVLREIKSDWKFMVEPNFNTVPLALELVDPSSNSQRTLPQFNALSRSLLGALQQTVNKHSTSFASAISTHNAFLNSLSAAQAEVREARATLVAAKEQLGGERKAEVGALYARGRVLKEMIAVLDTIEHLKAVPDHLDALVAEKRLLLASLVLVRALKTINKPEMLEIGALADLRSYLVNQETILKDILVEELHNHLYLKSYYSESRWRPYVRGQTTFSDPSSAASPLPFSLPSNTITPATPIASTRASSALPTGRNSPAPNNRPPASPTNPAGVGASSTSPTGSTATPAKLALYLEDLAMRPSQDPLLDIPDALDVLLSAISATTSSSSTLASSSTPASATRLLPVKLAASTNTSPEADSFGFIEHLVEALAALGRLGWALETLTQRQSAEVFALVEATVAEVEERAADRRRQNLAPTGAAMAMAPPPPSSTAISSSATVAGGSTLGSMATGIGVSGEAAAAAIGDATVLVGALHALDYSSSVDERAETLRDLFWTTYAKLDAVLQGLRVTWEVAGWIAGRKDFRDAPPSITTGGAPSAVASAPISASSTMQHKSSGGGSAVAIAADVVEIWKPIQAEVRTLLRDYLTSEDSSLASTRNPIASVNDVLRDGKTQRDRTKNVFRFVDSDAKVNARLVKMYDEDLLRSLRSSVPGLVGLDTASTAVSVDDRLSLAATSPAAATTTQHRTVVPPDAFNVPILFQPTLAFLARASAVMPIGFNEDETSGLDEFVVKVYLPRLEEKVSDLFGQATRAPNAFQEDPSWRTLTLRPVIKASVQVLALITNLCAMLRTTPFHRENYSRLIISIIIQFYQRCSGHFTDVVSRHSSSGGADGATSHLSLSGLWAQRVELTACMEELNRTSEDKPGRLRELGLQETRLELALKNEQVIEEDKLLASTRKFGQLGNLYMSLIWTMARLKELKGSVDDTASGLVSPPATTLTFETGPMDRATSGRDTVPEGGPQLPLTHAMAQRFEALLETYKQLSEMVLFTMRIEIRCRVMHFMDLAMRGNYRLEQEAFEPDPNVIDLIADLERFEEVAETTLPPRERSFVLRGLGPLVDDLLVSNSRHVPFANAFGVRKIMRNVLALQQSLKTIADDPSEADFLRGRAYWHLFFEGPKPMLDGLRLKGTTTTPPGTRGFSFEEYRAMLSLQMGVEQGPGASRGGGAKGGGGGGEMTTKPAPTSDKERRQYNEYLVSLMEVVRDE